MDYAGRQIPRRMTLSELPLSCACDAKKFYNKFRFEFEDQLHPKYDDLAPIIEQTKEERDAENEETEICPPEITSPEETEVCKMPVILEVPEEREISKEQVDEQQKRISFSENVEILHLTTPVSSISVNTHYTIEDAEIFSKSKHKNRVSIFLPSDEDFHSKTIQTILKPSFRESIISLQSFSEELLKIEGTKEDETNESIEEEIINIKSEEYLRKYKEIQEDKHKIKNMLVIIEEKLSALSTGIEEILLKDLKRNMNLVKDMFNMVQLKEGEIEKIEQIPKHIQDRRKTDLELWIVIQDLCITIESLPIKPTRSIPRQIFFDKHQKIKKPSTPRLKTYETIEERLHKISQGQLSKISIDQTEVEDERMYDQFSEKDFFRFLSYSDISQEDISRENLFKDTISDSDHFISSSEKSEEYNPFMKQAKYYLQSRHIQQFFRFLGAHLVAASPANPIEYLVDLLHRCYEYRDGHCMPPLLFEQRHIESLYHAFDPIGLGEITMDQYCTGMFTLGVPNFTHNPGVNQHLMINKETFIKDASTKLKEQLDEMLYIPDQSILLSPGRSSRTSISHSG